MFARFFRRSGVCGSQQARLLGRFDTDAESDPGFERPSVRDRLGAREFITADHIGHHLGRIGRRHHAGDTYDCPG